MKLERDRPTAWRLTLHPLELAGLMSAARWAVEGADGALPPEALGQLRRLLADYDRERARLTP